MQPAGYEAAVAVGPVGSVAHAEDAGPRPDPARLFALLAAAFAVALLLHQLWWNGVEVLSPHGVVVLAACAVLGRPRSVLRFAVLLATEVVAVGLDMPFVGSHVVLLLVVAAAALIQLLVVTGRTRRLPTPAAAFTVLAPFLRAAIVVVYAAAALAKLNTGFTDPARSCAGPMSQAVAWFDPSLLASGWRVEPAILGTVVVEIALPVLLLVRRTRVAGVLLGLAFHTVLALAGNVPFTAVALAFYVAFLPLDTPGRLGRFGPPPRPGRRGVLVPAALVAVWVGAAAVSAEDPALVGSLVANGTRVLVVALTVGAGVLLVRSRRGAAAPPRHQDPARLHRHPVLLVATLVLVADVLCPYVGLKTDASFEMFSNLRTEPGAWNHLLVPEAVRVFDAQDGAVRVVGGDPALVARTAGGTRIVPFELDRALRTRPGTTAVVDAGDGTPPRTVGPLPGGVTLLERLAVFRDVLPPTVPRC